MAEYKWGKEYADYDESDNELAADIKKTRYGKSLIERFTYLAAKKSSLDIDDNYFKADETRYA